MEGCAKWHPDGVPYSRASLVCAAALIDWQWDRISLHRMLQKIVSQPSAENSLRRLPKLKVGCLGSWADPVG